MIDRMDEIQQKIIEEDNVNRIRGNIKLVWWLAVIVLVFFGVILGIYRIANPNFIILKIFIFILILSIIILPIAIGFHIYTKRKHRKEITKEDSDLKLPEPISTDIARKLADDLLLDLKYNYFKNKVIDGSSNFGKTGRTLIYSCIGIGEYKDKVQDDGETWYAVIINQHYPSRNWIGEISGISDKKISVEQNRLAIDPSDEPSIEETITRNPLLGTETITKRKAPSVSDKNKKSKEKSEL